MECCNNATIEIGQINVDSQENCMDLRTCTYIIDFDDIGSEDVLTMCSDRNETETIRNLIRRLISLLDENKSWYHCANMQ